MAGGGELGALIRAYDWESTGLGHPAQWPQSLRVTLRIILNSRFPMFIWWGPDLIQFYNDAYRATMGPERHPSALGAPGKQCWSEIWDIIGPQIQYVLDGNGSTFDEDRLVPVTRNGARENVWWTYSYGPIDLEGTVGGVLVVCNDVTAQHLTTEALQNQTRHLRQLFEQAPSFMAVLRGPDHIFEITNASYRKLIGNRDAIGRPVRDVIPEARGQGFIDLLDNVYRTGQTHVGRRVPLLLEPGTPNCRDTMLDFVYAPILEMDGHVSGIFVEGNDVTDHINAENDLRLINEELKHRVRNTLTVVNAIATQTLRGTDDEALNKFTARLVAFSKAHDSLTAENWSTASIHDVIEGALAPHRSREDCFRVSGPPVRLVSKQAISLALTLHELATNAIKYGALSVDQGYVSIKWEAVANRIELVWEERDGPVVTKPVRLGFGSRLISTVLSNDFGGTVETIYEPNGLVCRLSMAFEHDADGRMLMDSENSPVEARVLQ